MIETELKPCPICGAKAYVMHDVVDGFEFGWSAGCPRFCLYDGLHGADENTPESQFPRVMNMTTKQDAIAAWNVKTEKIRECMKGEKRI